MRVLAAVVIPPHLNMSGAVNAAKALSQAVAEHCSVDIALMSSHTASSSLGRATLLERQSSNWLDFTRGFLPDKFRTLFYRSDIPDLVHRGQYDLVHLHNAIPALEMGRVAAACRRRGIPYVVSTHGFVEIVGKDRAYGLLPHERIAGQLFIDRPLRKVVDHAAKIFALSPMELPLLTSLGIKAEKVAIVTNGVNEFYFQCPDPTISARLHQDLQLPTGAHQPLTGFYLGNHTQNKGLHVLLDALMCIEAPYLMVIAGKKRNTLDYSSYCTRCRPGQRLIFTDQISDGEVLAFLHYANLFVFPTLADTLPLVILEAMAAGLPVLSTKVGGIPYQIDSSCGHLVPPGDVLALRTAIQQLSKDKAMLKQMGAAARQKVERQFRWQQSAAIALSEYASLCQVAV